MEQTEQEIIEEVSSPSVEKVSEHNTMEKVAEQKDDFLKKQE
jgi:hypothetical protein